MRFTKMEGAGNDYIYINGFEDQVDDPAALSVKMSRQHFGCGSDGLILILPSDVADFRMRMFNSDGSESGMCGNGIRCVAKYCHDRGLTDRTEFTVESGGEIKLLRLTLAPDGTTQSVRVDMGAPQLDGAKIPSAAVGCPVIGHTVRAGEHTYALTLVNMGNPHAVCFVSDPDTAAARIWLSDSARDRSVSMAPKGSNMAILRSWKNKKGKETALSLFCDSVRISRRSAWKDGSRWENQPHRPEQFPAAQRECSGLPSTSHR